MTGTPPSGTGARTPIVRRAVAGEGKTHWLVGHFLTLVLDDGVSPAGIAVITFTEAAGRELLDRVRAALDEVSHGRREARDATVQEVTRARRALAELGAAPIGTIHGFARRLLMQHAVSAEIPFGVEVREDIDPVLQAEMAARLHRRLAELRATRPVTAALRACTTGSRRRAFLDSDARGLIGRVPGALLRAPDRASHWRAEAEQETDRAWAELHALNVPGDGHLSEAAAHAELRTFRDGLARAATRLSATRAQDFRKRLAPADELLADLAARRPDTPAPRLKLGRLWWLTQKMRDDAIATGHPELDRIADLFDEYNDALERQQVLARRAYARVAGSLALSTYVQASARRADWLLQDELLQRALAMLLSDDDVLASLRQRFPVVLLDEAQDVDATQTELLLALTDSLVMVGDPQQSIFGFRGADVATFDALATRLIGQRPPENGDVTRRCLPRIVDTVNALFTGSSGYTRMRAFRAGVGPHLGTVTALLPPAPQDTSGADTTAKPAPKDFRIAQADALADQVVDLLTAADERRWVETATPDLNGQHRRPPRPADLAILVPSRTSVPAIEAALLARGVTPAVRTSRDLAAHPVAEGISAALLALANEEDTRALLIALRSPVFGCTDADLTRHAFQTDAPLSLPVHAALSADSGDERSGVPAVARCLDVLVAARTVMRCHGPAAALDLIVDCQAVLAVLAAADGALWLAGWTQICQLRESVDDRHRATPEPDGRFAAWLTEELAAAARTNAAVLDEPEAAGVTVTTIHQAKGLQWPIVLTAALTRDDPGTQSLSLDGDRVEVHLTNDYSTAGDTSPPPAPDVEASRLLYVALTRARDHLVISGLRVPGRGGSVLADPERIRSALTALSRESTTIVEVPVASQQRPNPDPVQLPSESEDRAGPGDVAARMNQLRESASQLLRREKPSGQPEAHSYSITDRDGSTGTATDVRSDRGATDGGPVGDSAANVGTLVHAVLAQVELATFTDRDRTLDDAIGDAWDLALQETSLQEAELAQAAVPGADEDRVRRLLASARMSQVLLRAAGADIVRRELSVNGHRFDGPDLVVSQGSIDLLFGERTPPGHLQAEDACDPDAVRWTLVDYKTDSTSVSDEEFADRYRSQLAAYRALLDDAGIHVAETWLIRIGTDGVSDVQI